MYLSLEETLFLIILLFLVLLLSLLHKSTLLKLRKTWFFLGLVSLLWIVTVLSLPNILRLMLPYLFPVLGIIAILTFASLGIKSATQSRQGREYWRTRPRLPSAEAKERKPPPNIGYSDEQKCPRCNVGVLRLVSEVRDTPKTTRILFEAPTTSDLRMPNIVWIRKRICQICGYDLTEREMPGGGRLFRDSEGNIWFSLH